MTPPEASTSPDVHDVLVEPDSRDRGVGRLLLDAALAFLKARGAPRVVLTTAEGTEVALTTRPRTRNLLARRTLTQTGRRIH